MDKKSLFIINLIILALFLVTFTLVNEGLNLNLTGFAFADFYDTEVMYTLNAISNEKTTFVIPIKNDRETPLEEVYAEITITNLDGEEVGRTKTDTITIEPNSETEIKAEWENNVLPGDYLANIYISSSDSNAVFKKTFKIEQRTITIESIQVDEFQLGETIKMDILVQNYLSKEIENTRANILIYNEEENIISSITTENYKLNSSKLNKLTSEWNTEGLSPGTYNAKVQVESEEYKSEKDLVFNIGQNSLQIAGVGFAINYAPKNQSDNIALYLIFGFLIVAINIIIWVVYLKKKK